jgi:putative serine protease PepD
MTDEQRATGSDADAPTQAPTNNHRVLAMAGAPAAGATTPSTGSMPPGNPYGWRPSPGTAGPTMPPPPNTAVPTPSGPRRRRPVSQVVVAAVIAAVVAGAGGVGAGYALLDHTSGSSQLTVAPATGQIAPAAGTVAGAAAAVLPSTVDIQVTLAQGTAEGSGVILTADGDVLTNNHVIDGATGPITVTMSDGSQHTATVVGASPSYDLAVIKLDGVSGLTPATLGSSADLQVGQEVVAIGSPQGLEGTVTSGIVSALDRTVAVQTEDGSAVVYNGLQTDASINPGNSGGPLVDLQGHVVGIDSAEATTGSSNSATQSGSVGLGFAIPVDQAKRVAQELMAGGTATKPTLGVTGSATATTEEGAQLASVVAGSPAAQAGLAAGDVITAVNGTKVEDFADLIARIGAQTPGGQVTLTVGTGGSSHQVTVTLGSTPDTAQTTSTGGQTTSPFGNGNGGSGSGNGGN